MWLDPGPPPVTTTSAPQARASPRRNSSLRALLPPRPTPVRSSRLTHTSRPSASDSRGAAWRGVGRVARRTRGAPVSPGGRAGRASGRLAVVRTPGTVSQLQDQRFDGRHDDGGVVPPGLGLDVDVEL